MADRTRNHIPNAQHGASAPAQRPRSFEAEEVSTISPVQQQLARELAAAVRGSHVMQPLQIVVGDGPARAPVGRCRRLPLRVNDLLRIDTQFCGAR